MHRPAAAEGLLAAVGVEGELVEQAFGVERGQREALLEEGLPLLRRLWSEDRVTHHGAHFHLEEALVRPRPRRPLDVWLGGSGRRELERTGRLADGWLPSFITPAEAEAGRAVIEAAAAGAGREVEDEHYGAIVPYVHGAVPDSARRALATRRGGAVSDADLVEVVASGFDGLRARLQAFIAAGVSKFVVRPLLEPASWEDELTGLAREILPVQTRSGVSPPAV